MTFVENVENNRQFSKLSTHSSLLKQQNGPNLTKNGQNLTENVENSTRIFWIFDCRHDFRPLDMCQKCTGNFDFQSWRKSVHFCENVPKFEIPTVTHSLNIQFPRIGNVLNNKKKLFLDFLNFKN